MKKVIAWALCAVMMLSMTACGGEEPAEEQMITRAAEETAPAVMETAAPEMEAETPAATEAEAPAAVENLVDRYIFQVENVELIPGDVFDPSILPEADSVYEVPSCAIEGTDNLYNYGTYELTAFDDGTNELIYSILLIDPNITTTEGLALGDSVEKMVELYGDGYAQQDNAYTYTGEEEILYIIAQNDSVVSIEYRMIVD